MPRGFGDAGLKGVAATRPRFWLVSFVFVVVGAVAVCGAGQAI